ncbi:MAG: hypothetical protein OER56_01115 [Hyphomicrobiales bacterium]|nr:hypothetical protein [Hyphomicrobiales bacterium]
MSEILGTTTNDTLSGTNDGDVIRGYQGDDTINGLDGNDVIYGDGSLQRLDTNGISVTNETVARFELESIAKGFHNTVGMYKVSTDGTIHSVNVLFSPEGGKNGGQAVYPHKTIDVKLAAGEQLGFFVLGNGYGKGDTAALLNDPDAKWEMRTANGDPGLIVDKNLMLVHVDPVTGESTPMAQGKGHEIFHSLGTAENGYAPNPDGTPHAVSVVDTATGTVRLGLEAQKNGGNLSYDDAIILIKLGANNIQPLDGALEPIAGTHDDIIDAGDGDDTVFGQSGDDRLLGGNGEDYLSGGSGDDYISGGADDDTISGGSGDDDIDGGGGDDDINGGTDDDAVYGGDGDDNISGGKQSDTIYGEAGNDIIFGDTGDDVVDGGDGDDTVLGGEGNDEVYGGAGNDYITGGKGHDTLDGGSGNDDVDADSGDDIIIAGYGTDSYNGGSGTDWIDYSAATTGVDVNLHSHVATSDLGTDSIWSVENVIGSAQNDTLTGDKRENLLKGGDGDDWLRGGKADDTLEGGDGSDTYNWSRKDVIGETGTDDFVDIIIGFSSDDILDLSALTEITGAQTATDVVQLTVSGGNTTVSALDADNGVWVDVVVLTDVNGLSVTALDTDGQLIL